MRRRYVRVSPSLFRHSTAAVNKGTGRGLPSISTTRSHRLERLPSVVYDPPSTTPSARIGTPAPTVCTIAAPTCGPTRILLARNPAVYGPPPLNAVDDADWSRSGVFALPMAERARFHSRSRRMYVVIAAATAWP